jgi:heme/copper-type cytochrome/quinol oxidase subunit 3
MTIALPAAHAPAPKRQMLVATTAASTVAAMLMAGMLAMWLRFRAAAPVRESSDGLKLIKDWLPANLHIPEVATNTMFATFFVGCVMAQWAVYAAKRRDTAHVNLALAVCFIIGAAIINAQIAVYLQFDIGIADGAYQVMFYTITGTMIVLVALAMVFTAVALFRSIGGRATSTDVFSSHALYWYAITVIFTAVWFVVYVQK